MNVDGEGQRRGLVEWLRRLIVIGGYAMGACWLLEALLRSLTGLIELHRVRIPLPRLVFALWAEFALLAASGLLLSGTWAFQKHRRWGRPVLFASAGLMIATVVASHAIFLFDQVMMVTYSPDVVGLRKAAIITGGISLAICQSLFPVILVLCLRRPELTDSFPDSHRGFPPLFDSERPTPAIPVGRTEES